MPLPKWLLLWVTSTTVEILRSLVFVDLLRLLRFRKLCDTWFPVKNIEMLILNGSMHLIHEVACFREY